MNQLKATIESHHFFKQFKPEHLDLITSGAKSESFKPGEIIVREGDPANMFYLIESGQIVLETKQPGDGLVLIQHLGPGELIGWSWLVPPFVWHFNARAAEPTRVIVMNGAALLAQAEKNHDFGFQLMKTVMQIVLQRLQATRIQLLTSRLQTEAASAAIISGSH